MANEIEKMTNIQQMASEAECKQIDAIIDTLSRDFEAMLDDSRKYVLTGEKVARNFDNSISAIGKMKEIGMRYGIDFPEVNTDQEAAVYVLKFGKEIVHKK